MKKSVRVISHVFFWILFPLVNVFSKWADARDVLPGFESLPKPGFFQILGDSFHSLLIPVDVGRPIMDISNLVGIVFNFFIYLIIPIGVFYLFYGLFIPGVLKVKSLRNKLLPVFFVLLVPLLITTTFKFFTIAVAWKFTYCVTLTYIVTIIFAAFGSFFRILENWIISEKLAKQNLQSELALLKNQINPHFLFNTLNNIDSLIKSNVDKASETLVKLSEILRYMIYDTNIDKTLLSNELKQIESYVDLQKIQFSNKELVSVSIQGNPDKILIAPMLFIPFVENAFKHCNNKNIQNAIKIYFSIDNRTVNFECVNIFDKSRKITKDNASGVGLSIIKRRIELIYPDKHFLSITDDHDTFKVTLSINTHEH
jgi:two-component system, LytTR family, sensor kinase